MPKYFKIAVAQARPLQYKNCYQWALVRYDENTGKCFYRNGAKLNVCGLSDAVDLHIRVTAQKPYGIKSVVMAEFYGVELAIIDFAADNNLMPQILTADFYSNVKPLAKPWPGYNLKKVNDLSFLNL